MHLPDSQQGREVTAFQILILVLSLYVVAAIFIDTVIDLPTEVSKVLGIVDTVICGIFLADVSIRFYRAENKLTFWKWGWIDLVASIPNFSLLRFGRVVRVLRVIRLLRAVRSTHAILMIVLENRIKNLFFSIFLITFLLVTASSVAILICEKDPDSNIKTAGDAVWWSVATVTTVGYGDKYPVTWEGRTVAILLMFSGVGLFGTFSGLLATYFLGLRSQTECQIADLSKQIALMNERLDALIKSHDKD
jgi:voltage-gated potassium channel